MRAVCKECPQAGRSPGSEPRRRPRRAASPCRSATGLGSHEEDHPPLSGSPAGPSPAAFWQMSQSRPAERREPRPATKQVVVPKPMLVTGLNVNRQQSFYS